MWRQLVLPALICLSMAVGGAKAQNIDPHDLFEARCSRCHEEHGGSFARNALAVLKDGVLVGKQHSEPLESYLASHFGRPTPAEIAVLINMFNIQVRTGGVYALKCRICHDDAKTLARTKLILKNGTLAGRYTGHVMENFLTNHGRLSANEVDTVHAMLVWQLESVGRN